MIYKLKDFKIKSIKINKKKNEWDNSVYLCLTEGDVFNLSHNQILLTDLGDCFLLELRPFTDSLSPCFRKMTKDFKRSTTGHSDPGEAIELPMFDEALSSTNQWKRIFRPSRKGIVDNLKDFKTKESSILVKNENDEYFLVSK